MGDQHILIRSSGILVWGDDFFNKKIIRGDQHDDSDYIDLIMMIVILIMSTC